MGSSSSACVKVDVDEISHSTLDLLPINLGSRTFSVLEGNSTTSPPNDMAGQSNPNLSVTSSISNISLSSSDGSSSSGSATSSVRKTNGSLAPPPLRRANSLSSMHLKDSVSTPTDRTVDKVAARIHAIISDHNRPARTNLRSFPQFEPNVRQVFALARVGLLENTSRDPLDHHVPSPQLIADFIADLSVKSQLEKGCVVVALVYLERLMQTAQLRVTSLNWRHVVFSTILMASKVWDDVSMWNVDFASVSQFFSLRQANEMEALILDLLNWNVILTPAEYAATFLSLFDSATDLASSGVTLSDITVSANELAPSASLPVLSPELSSDPFGALAPPALSRIRSCGDEFHQALQPLALSA